MACLGRKAISSKNISRKASSRLLSLFLCYESFLLSHIRVVLLLGCFIELKCENLKRRLVCLTDIWTSIVGIVSKETSAASVGN